MARSRNTCPTTASKYSGRHTSPDSHSGRPSPAFSARHSGRRWPNGARLHSWATISAQCCVRSACGRSHTSSNSSVRRLPKFSSGCTHWNTAWLAQLARDCGQSDEPSPTPSPQRCSSAATDRSTGSRRCISLMAQPNLRAAASFAEPANGRLGPCPVIGQPRPVAAVLRAGCHSQKHNPLALSVSLPHHSASLFMMSKSVFTIAIVAVLCFASAQGEPIRPDGVARVRASTPPPPPAHRSHPPPSLQPQLRPALCLLLCGRLLLVERGTHVASAHASAVVITMHATALARVHSPCCCFAAVAPAAGACCAQ